MLRHLGVSVKYYADTYRHGGTFQGLPVLSASELLGLRGGVSVIIGSAWAHEIYRSLREKGFSGKVFVMYTYFADDDGTTMPQEEALLRTFEEDVARVREILTDETSCAVLDALHDARMTCSAERCAQAVSISMAAMCEPQYFPQEVLAVFRGGVFIDCGAYNGDTVQAAVDLGLTLDGSVCFEPDDGKRAELIERLATLNLAGKVTVVDKGVWREDTRLAFAQPKPEAGCTRIDETGDGWIDVVSLDSILADSNIDMIKMDIEGAELDALRGAAQVIRRTRPIMAVCVYHKFWDLTRIPLLLADLLDDCDFYLRQHMATSETVFYAIPRHH
jgi:FkbM family methyltransferase